ncbi:MAG: metal-dependent transcriptional regulator [Candidatus Enteromonas sp.]|nr:metal-dependent transcriptional regulator [Candidatus Enteromonas sp.]
MKRNSQFSRSQEDFLEALLMLDEAGEPLATTKVAKMLHISKPAVHQMGHELINRGLITREDYGDMALTEKGRAVAAETLRRHRLLHDFLIRLGVSEETAEMDCCEIEHALSDETVQKIEEFLKK